ncbi:hypothetical protein BST83_02415 [Polaribacter filamentus]|uniref:Uncharacterized protein n=2 Tax=Polaribacter filamentus TaxID=53483 RepID=A0A2S7KUG2_9FLAO|nr:hypothetical protein BST83_02415 [Polaribacter filamentus]
MFLCFFVLSSCYESLDFNQVDDYVSKPVFTSAFTYFTLVPAQFFDSNGTQKNSISDITNFYGFQNTYVKDNLVKLDFSAEIKNEFDREVTIQVDFLNNSDIVVYSFTPIIVEAGDLNLIFLEEIEVASHPAILNTTKVNILTTIENTGTQMDPNDISELVFKSSVTLFIESGI